jgi:hypothetical protein
MKVLTHSLVRSAIYVAGLFVAFGLGAQLTKPSPSQGSPTSSSINHGTTKSSVSSTMAATTVIKRPSFVSETREVPGKPAVPTPNSRLAALIDYASKLDAAQTLAALRKLDLEADSPEAKLARHVLVARFAELDPLTAMTYVDTLSSEERSTQQINALASWASHDAVKAAAYFEDNMINGGLAGDDEVGAAAVIAGEWAQRDTVAAWNWVSSLTPDARGEAIKRVAAKLAATNPTVALQAIASMPEAYERAEAMTPIAMQWAQTAPSNTADWVATLRDPAEQSNAATGLVSAWMQTNPYAVSEWVSKLSAGQTRDAAIKAMINAQAVRNDPETAAFWAVTVQDQTLRDQLVNETEKRWQIHDPEAAQRWLATNGR